MASLGASRISCPLQGHERCSGGNEKGFTKKYFIDHLGTRHFKTDVVKASYKTRIASYFSLFSALDQTLHQAGIWLCGECFCTHTFSKNCKHDIGVMVPAPRFDDVDNGLEGAASGVPPLGGELTFDVNLLDRFFSKKLRTVKCIPPGRDLALLSFFVMRWIRYFCAQGTCLHGCNSLFCHLVCCPPLCLPTELNDGLERENAASSTVFPVLCSDGGILWTGLVW
jgi:hypothetical protein